MSSPIIVKRTIAISAIYEVALNIKDIAWNGSNQLTSVDALLSPILRKEDQDENPINIYGNKDNIENGINCFKESLQSSQKVDREVNRYVYSLIYLANKLNSNTNMLTYINRELDHIRDLTGYEQSTSENDNFYAIDDEHIIRQLATIYQNSISKLGPRILISGKSDFLAQEETAQTIRALLLSGIRSAILWHRNGGSRLQLLFNRNAYINSSVDLLTNNN